MASYVVKIQFEDSLRRLTVSGDVAFSFAQLETRIRDLFHLPTSSQLVLTYFDSDGDVVTMAEDQDLRDAFVLQSLNPLRLNVAILPGAKGNVGSDIRMADAPPAGDGNGRSSEGTWQAEKTADINSESAAAEKLTENKTAARLNENAAPAGETGNEEEKAVGKDKGAAPASPAGKEEQVIHYGITCDDCGASPIAGSRFKSTKKYDYDLCRACFDKPGVDTDEYFMVERRFHRPALRHPFWGGRMRCPSSAFDSRNPNSRNGRATAEFPRSWGSRCPGAEAVRGGAHENGQAPPPAADQEKQNGGGSASVFVHRGVKCDGCGMNPITGPRFKSNTKYDYDICSGCFEKSEDSVKEEYSRIDHSVNGVYPVVLRRVYSAASPCRSPMCGRGIWIINKIAQEQAQKKEAEKGAQKEAADQRSTEEKSGAAEAVPEDATQSRIEENSTAAAAATAPEKEAEVLAVTKEVPVTQADPTQQAEPQGEPETEKKTSMTQADATVEDSTVPVSVNSVQNDTAATAAPEGDDLSTFDGLLTKLAAMGFADKQLNEELLKKNNMDLRTTLDDLCAAEEWDPILEELEEMGFYDTDMNRRLMFANNGSVKRVVKELVQNAKGPATAASKGEKQA